MTVSVLLDGEESTIEFHDVTDNQVLLYMKCFLTPKNSSFELNMNTWVRNTSNNLIMQAIHMYTLLTK